MLMFAKSRARVRKDTHGNTVGDRLCGGKRAKRGWWKQSLWIALQSFVVFTKEPSSSASVHSLVVADLLTGCEWGVPMPLGSSRVPCSVRRGR
jgi:hypothetical protein